MKKQRIIHGSVALLNIAWVLIAWHYLPPWLAHNPGVILIMLTFIVESIAHFVWHDQ